MMMMKMTKTKTEQNGFLADFSGDSQTCLGAAPGASVESSGQDKGPLSSLQRIASHERSKVVVAILNGGQSYW